MRRHILLITGLPGAGKTTVLRKTVVALAGRSVRGFLTDELRSGGRRVGFQIQSLAGRSSVLAHEDFLTGRRVGRYGVDIDALDRIIESALAVHAGTELYLVDEIGKMECFSRRFVAAMRVLLDSEVPVVATIARHGGGFIAEVKDRPDIELKEVTQRNRDEMPGRILRWLEEVKGRSGRA